MRREEKRDYERCGKYFISKFFKTRNTLGQRGISLYPSHCFVFSTRGSFISVKRLCFPCKLLSKPNHTQQGSYLPSEIPILWSIPDYFQMETFHLETFS